MKPFARVVTEGSTAPITPMHGQKMLSLSVAEVAKRDHLAAETWQRNRPHIQSQNDNRCPTAGNGHEVSNAS